MPVIFKCESCTTYLSVRKKFIGKLLRCPECSTKQRIPDPRDVISVKLKKEEKVKKERKDKKDKKKKRKEKKEKPGKDSVVSPDSHFDSVILGGDEIEINCLCGAHMKVPADQAGTIVECVACGEDIIVPDPDALDDDVGLVPLDDDDDSGIWGDSDLG